MILKQWYRNKACLRKTVCVGFFVAACNQVWGVEISTGNLPSIGTENVPEVLEMGGAKSVTSFFITSRGLGNGGNLGGLTGADAHCQALAEAEYAGDHTWRAYLSTSMTDDRAAVNARDRMGRGDGGSSWNSAHSSRGCSQQDLEGTGGAGLFYCFAID